MRTANSWYDSLDGEEGTGRAARTPKQAQRAPPRTVEQHPLLAVSSAFRSLHVKSSHFGDAELSASRLRICGKRERLLQPCLRFAQRVLQRRDPAARVTWKSEEGMDWAGVRWDP